MRQSIMWGNLGYLFSGVGVGFLLGSIPSIRDMLVAVENAEQIWALVVFLGGTIMVTFAFYLISPDGSHRDARGEASEGPLGPETGRSSLG